MSDQYFINRQNKLRELLAKNNLDGMLVTILILIRYLCGFTGSAGVAIITNDSAAIFVDGRYTVQVKEQVDSAIYNILHLAANPFMKWLKESLPEGTRLGYDSRFHRKNWVKIAK